MLFNSMLFFLQGENSYSPEKKCIAVSSPLLLNMVKRAETILVVVSVDGRLTFPVDHYKNHAGSASFSYHTIMMMITMSCHHRHHSLHQRFFFALFYYDSFLLSFNTQEHSTFPFFHYHQQEKSMLWSWSPSLFSPVELSLLPVTFTDFIGSTLFSSE